jgi:hypothetical protein
MILPNGIQNAYEDGPEHLKELTKHNRGEKGRRLTPTPLRQTLVQKHKEHLKLLSEAKVPTRTIILPFPYPPSRKAIKDASQNNKVSTHLSRNVSTVR